MADLGQADSLETSTPLRCRVSEALRRPPAALQSATPSLRFPFREQIEVGPYGRLKGDDENEQPCLHTEPGVFDKKGCIKPLIRRSKGEPFREGMARKSLTGNGQGQCKRGWRNALDENLQQLFTR